MTKPPAQQPKPLESADGDFAAALNASLDGWNAAMGLRFLRATGEEVAAELEIGSAHRQPYGIVHGGVHSGIIESLFNRCGACGPAQGAVRGGTGEPHVISARHA